MRGEVEREEAGDEDASRRSHHVVRTLVEEGRTAAVLDVVNQLATKNSELAVRNNALATKNRDLAGEKAALERRLEQLVAFRRKNEGISTNQLLLFLNELTGESADDSGNTKATDQSGPLWPEMIDANDKSDCDAEIERVPQGLPRPPVAPLPIRRARRARTSRASIRAS